MKISVRKLSNKSVRLMVYKIAKSTSIHLFDYYFSVLVNNTGVHFEKFIARNVR